MKRENFEIRVDGDLIKVKHAWNSAIREIPKIVKTRINDMGGEAREISSQIRKDETQRFHIGGRFIWQGANGKQLIFTVEKV